MKDYVFIGWSRNREVAIELKKILDGQGFVCVVGGQYENNPESVRNRRGTVNETINFQMNHCDQSILLFQKIDDNVGISGNLIYELGYINAQYNYIQSPTKLHIFRIDITRADDALFPTDLGGIWGSSITSGGRSEREIAQEIAQEFLKNQAQIAKSDKFRLLNNHYFIEYELKRHIENPAMSDYDLAMNLLVYVQSAFCYQEQNDIRLKVERFKSQMVDKAIRSTELEWATNYAIQTLDLYCLTVPDEDSGVIRMPGVTFRGILNEFREIGERIAQKFPEVFGGADFSEMKFDEAFYHRNDFEAWLVAQMQEHVTYLILVYLLNSEIAAEEKEYYARLGVKYCRISIKNLELLAKFDENKMYAKLLLGYAYKNMSTFCAVLGMDAEVASSREASFRLRREVYSYVNGISAIQPSLKEYIALEYLLQAVERAAVCGDKYERSDYLREIGDYIRERSKSERNRSYMFRSLIESYKALTE